MNRPNKDNYTKYWIKENDQYVLRGLGQYYVALEKYCDELEAELKKIKSRATFDHTLNLEAELKNCCIEIEILKRALDKACNKLFDSMVELDDNVMVNPEQWKEWLMEEWKNIRKVY